MSVMAMRYEDIPARGDGFTVADLRQMPDDGRRYELVDGVLLVSPAPRWRHQHASLELAVLLRSACPNHLAVLPPIDVPRGNNTSLQPDLSVVRKEDLSEERFTSVPVLVVEILSPSTAGFDTLLKRDAYARLGVPHYWIVDLDEPSVTVLDLHDEAFVDQAVVHGGSVLDVDSPFPVAFRPVDLLPT